jgi:hypothetical protein
MNAHRIVPFRNIFTKQTRITSYIVINAIRIVYNAKIETINVRVVIRDIYFLIHYVWNTVLFEPIYQMIKKIALIVVRIVYSVLIIIIVCKKSKKNHVHRKVIFLFKLCFASNAILIVLRVILRARAFNVMNSIFRRMDSV